MRIRCRFALFCAALLVSSNAFARPYRIAILYDPGAKDYASSMRDAILAAEPFKGLQGQLDIQLVAADADKLKCQGGCLGIDRVICCDDAAAALIASPLAPEKILIATSAAEGGAAGSIGVVGKGYPAQTALHEMIHTFGFDDEYEYSLDEAKVYCCIPTDKIKCLDHQSTNVACFKPRSSYLSDVEAKKLHGGDFGWSPYVENPTLITHGDQLGTVSSYPAEKAALFPGGSCNKVSPCFKPYLGPTIMESVSELVPNIPLYHQAKILKAMEAERGEAFSTSGMIPSSDSTGDSVSDSKSSSAH